GILDSVCGTGSDDGDGVGGESSMAFGTDIGTCTLEGRG
ncbi:hypothetical protein A2U01_0055796, partial [Trifolium medium]|nr:hypothetical protein [Trifolium medium]